MRGSKTATDDRTAEHDDARSGAIASNASSNKRANLMFLVRCAIGGGAVFSAFLLAMSYHYGSIRAFIAKCRGETFVVAPEAVDLGTVESSTESSAVFTIRNISSKSIDVVGARTACSCVVASGLPIAVAPGREEEVTFRVYVSGRDRNFSVPISVFVNDGLLRTCEVSIRAMVEKRPK